MQPFTNSASAPHAAEGAGEQAVSTAGGQLSEMAAAMPAGSVRSDTVVELRERSPVLVRRTIELVTERPFHVIDVTGDCEDLVSRAGVQEGVLTVFNQHTTCAVKINERETCFLEDLRLFMEALVPTGGYYRHDDFEIRDPETLESVPEEEPVNGHAHIKQMLLGSASESVPVVGGQLALGRWQRIMFVELDQSRRRAVHLQVHGWR